MKGVVVHEVGPRDGLQAESTAVPTEQKARWIEALVAAHVDVVQVGSFVSPEKLPQMADTDALFHRLNLPPIPGAAPRRTVLSGLVLNEKGLERGLACGVELFCMGVSASETHSRKNTGMGIEEATRRIVATARQALAAGRPVQVSVQSAFGCGYEGYVPEERVLSIAKSYADAGFLRISLADTAGHAHPDQVERLYGKLLEVAPGIDAACHFHDTYGLGMANIFAAMRAGVSSFETSFAGLGGCPFTKSPAGNVATEDLVHTLNRMGRRLDVDLHRLIALAKEVETFFGREMPGRVHRSGPIPVAEEVIS